MENKISKKLISVIIMTVMCIALFSVGVYTLYFLYYK